MIHSLLLAALLASQVSPQSGLGDPRIQLVNYDPNQVTRLEVAPGYHLTVIFASGERIESVAVGDATAWEATINGRGDYLFLKPRTSSATTNMTVITDTRIYSFELVPGYAGSGPFAVRFAYPAEASAEASPVEGEALGRYALHGDEELLPNALHDDGRQTYIAWSPDTSLPAVFALDERREEVLVDGNMIDGRYVIPRVYSRIIFRLGDEKAYADRLEVE